MPLSNANPFARKPTERTYTALGYSLMALVAAIIVYLRFIPTDRAIGFRLVVSMLLLMNLLYWRLADRRLTRYVINSKLSATARIALALFIVIINIPVADMILRGRMPDYLVTWPSFYAAAVVIWHLCLVVFLSILSAARLIVVLVYRLAKWVRGQWQSMSAASNATAGAIERSADGTAQNAYPDLNRRRFLQTACVGVPAVVFPAATIASVLQEDDLLVRRVRLPAPWLPKRLRGLTISHVSDLHVGRHYRPHMLPKLVDIVGKLDSDLVLVTGDIVDVSNEMLPPAIEALRQMPVRYGMYHVIGNHDQIDNRAEWIAAMRRHFNLLIDERRSIEIGGERLTIAGLDYAHNDVSTPGRPGHDAHARQALHQYHAEREGPVIALAHHPHAFDALRSRGVPLTLSGHTHGGQIMLTPPGSALEIGAGNLLFRYIRGTYRRSDAALFVNAGVGNWFPLRINAPAEVVQIQLV